MKTAIGIDLGGTNVKGIIVNETGEVLKQHYVATHDDDEGKWRESVLEMVTYLRNYWQNPIDTIGMSSPGLPDPENTCISFLPNRLNGLENFDWSSYFGQRTYILNDAHSALMAEASFGAAKGYKNVVLLTLGTGVGGGLLINGQLYQGLSQMAGHLGHLSLNATDDETRTQYQSAKQALLEQQQYRDKLSTRRDRLVAKLHHHVAALEKFQLAALGARSQEARPVLGRLAELSAEVSSTSEALMEVESAA